jgi:hypothetical protein
MGKHRETQLVISGNLGYVKDVGAISASIDKLFGLIEDLIKSIQRRTSE